MATLYEAAEKLNAAGYDAKVWQGRRVYIKRNGKDLGYIGAADLSGGTGTCKSVRQSGAIAAILRSA